MNSHSTGWRRSGVMRGSLLRDYLICKTSKMEISVSVMAGVEARWGAEGLAFVGQIDEGVKKILAVEI
ncbi:hypothetical protein [Rubritalea tangerina]|uniref:hypothetical protein n=1 Tax=Rubritalea tangerina TaxID=430798 RepID=UPI0036128014